MSTFRGWPEWQTYSAIDGAREFMAEWLDTWEVWEFEVEDFLDAGERVVAIVRRRGRPGDRIIIGVIAAPAQVGQGDIVRLDFEW